MPRRQTQLRGPKDQSSQKQGPKRVPKRKAGKALNALSIAEQQFPTKVKIRRNRLGERDDPAAAAAAAARKRNHGRDEGDSDGPDFKRRRTVDDSSENGGSDSEGHEWRLGEVGSDDDSDLDSDEAMGESDEERFEGFAFRGSSTMKSKPKTSDKAKRSRQINLDEDADESEDENMDEDDDDDDLGDDAVDLTTAWDMNMAEEEEENKKASKSKKPAENDDSEEYDSESEDDESEEESDDDAGLSDEDDADNEYGLSKLQNFVNSMNTEPTNKPGRKSGAKQEHGKPTEYGLTSSRKLTLADLMPSITDSRLKNSLKNIDSAPQKATSSGIPGKLDAPLAKRQQDKLERAAAYEKSKETMDRWLDTVKANRRAEHLMFPLPDPDAQQTDRIDTVKPQNDLENAIQNILQESGLVEENGKSAEDQFQEFEELQARKLPIEEIQARRAELRKRRDLMFREEVRSKRIKKIKSKSYRRVHRKERERLEQQERQALLEAGVDLDEQEKEKNERMRAEARMGSKHRESKWAKSLKQTGRTAWDDEARHGAAELAQKEEELRKRIEGKRVSHGDDDYLGSSSSESEDEDPWQEADSDYQNRKLRQKLDKVEGGDDAAPELKGPHSKLLSMKFMQNAEASRKAQNDAEVRRLNRDLHGEESQSEAESEVGRRKFGQSQGVKPQKKPQTQTRNEFEEAPGSDDEEMGAPDAEQDVDIVVDRPEKQKTTRPVNNKSQSLSSSKPFEKQESAAEEENPWLVQTNRNNRRATADDSQPTVDISLTDSKSNDVVSNDAPKSQKAKKSASKKQTVQHDDDSDDESNVPVLLKNHDLVKRAFAGDEVVQDFDQEKEEAIEEEGDQVIDNTLPGWGNWAGDGVSKKQQKRQKRFTTTVEGVKPENRKDAKLSRVIINEKRVKKNNKYLATQLPHPFETKQQYERSLRLPIGPEWSTKETHQSSTKPRVMVKQGVIKAMEKPMV
ncbi:hypothetical protein MW887_010349 [Aspergillus wentii]|nr:hypothetical protein MW887_010349 [Aspergillus wentii]